MFIDSSLRHLASSFLTVNFLSFPSTFRVAKTGSMAYGAMVTSIQSSYFFQSKFQEVSSDTVSNHNQPNIYIYVCVYIYIQIEI